MNDQTQQVHPLVRFKGDMAAIIAKKELALPSNVSEEAFKNAAIVAVQDNPSILNCDRGSVMKSLRTLAAAGLVPDGREAAIVPFKGKAQAMPMVFGLIKMARRSGDVQDIRAHIVFQNELDAGKFTYVVGDEEKLEHRPILFGEKGDPVAVYAIAKLKDGTIIREFMDAAQIEKVRKSSSNQNGNTPTGIWAQWNEEMWKKSVIRRLCKRLDLSAEDMRRVMVEQDATPIRDVTPEPEERVTLAQRLEAREQEAEPEAAIEGEVMPPEDEKEGTGHWTDDADHNEGLPGSTEWEEGEAAFVAQKPITDCPYEGDLDKANDWLGGWLGAEKAAS